MQSGQNKVNNLKDLPINLFELSNTQKNNMLLGINFDNLDESQISLAKNILLSNGFITEEKDKDLDINISKNEFD